MTLPEDMQDEEIAMRACMKRAADMGDRLRHFTQKGGFDIPGGLNFAKAGVFSWVKDAEGAKIVEVVHSSGAKVVVPSKAPLDSDFDLVDNECDWKASFVATPIIHTIHTWFPNDSAWKRLMYTPGKRVSVLHVVAKAVAQEVLGERSRGKSSVEITAAAKAALQTAVADRSKDSLKKARGTWEQKKLERRAHKRIKLT